MPLTSEQCFLSCLDCDLCPACVQIWRPAHKSSVYPSATVAAPLFLFWVIPWGLIIVLIWTTMPCFPGAKMETDPLERCRLCRAHISDSPPFHLSHCLWQKHPTWLFPAGQSPWAALILLLKPHILIIPPLFWLPTYRAGFPEFFIHTSLCFAPKLPLHRCSISISGMNEQLNE